MNQSKTYKRRRAIPLWLPLPALIVILILIGYFIGRWLTPPRVKTETVTVYEPMVQTVENKLPEVADIKLYDIPLSKSLQTYIYEICAEENVPVPLILAMIEHESRFNPEVISSTNDYGLMQINQINHAWLAEEYRTADMLDPYQNVFCGVKIIGGYLSKYGDVTKALMAYNMGDYGASKAWQNGITSTSYTDSILSLMAQYEEVSGDADSD